MRIQFRKIVLIIACAPVGGLLSSCSHPAPPLRIVGGQSAIHSPEFTPRPDLHLTTFQQKLVTSMEQQKSANIRYKDEYYVGGEPPANIGVCTDVVVRAFRAAGVDLQKRLARDIAAHSGAYHVGRADRNIDHRRCTNLIVFFKRNAEELSNSAPTEDWLPGDIVFYDTGARGKIDHVALVGPNIGANSHPTIVQAWPGMMVQEIDGLFGHKIVGHYRWKS
ncbi:MAG: DUF1287 domain-containing protein [Chthonomonadales bacterium]